jgi:hypothetical protein
MEVARLVIELNPLPVQLCLLGRELSSTGLQPVDLLTLEQCLLLGRELW